jgi:hypothetical protein
LVSSSKNGLPALLCTVGSSPTSPNAITA